MRSLECVLVVLSAVLMWPVMAEAQCSTEDLDRNGVPDDCPAGSIYIAGTTGDDTINGTKGPDCIYGFGGNDDLYGFAGNDYICGGLGDDTLEGGDGDDELFGEGGTDVIMGGTGNDVISGGDGTDIIQGEDGDDTINGGADRDSIAGGNGADVLSGDDGGDKIDGGAGDDFISGGNGDDVLAGSEQNDVIHGGSGNDTIIGGSGADTLSGEDGDDAIDGGADDDSLSGGPGIDTLDGGGGTNTCVEEVPGTPERLTNCDIVTYAAVRDLELVQTRHGLAVTWVTTTEVGTVAFRVWRVEADEVLTWVGEIAAAPDGSPHGARYFLRDDAAPTDGFASYLLEERTVSVGSVLYGPFTRSPVKADARHSFRPSRARQGRVPHRVRLERLSRPKAVEQRHTFARKAAPTPTGAVLVVDQAGVIEVDAAAIADALGSSSDGVMSLIREGGLDLRLGGESIAWHAVNDGAALRFVAPEVRSPFSLHHRYLLSVGDGLTMETGTVIQSNAVEPHEFVDTRRFEQDVFPGPSGGPDPRQDLFFWHALSSEAQVAISVALPGLSSPQAEELRVIVHGATEHPEQPHRVEVHWNQQSLGVFDLVGRKRHTIAVPLDGVASELENELVVQQHVAGEAPPALYVDAVEVDYPRLAEADGPAFRFGGAYDGMHSVTGLESETADLYEVTDPTTPRHCGELLLDEPGGLRFTVEGSDLRFLAATPAGVMAPLEVTPHFATSLRSSSHNVDYVIIAASHLVTDAQALADLREADGYRVLLVDIDDVYWAFTDGEPDPLAVRHFLAFAWEEWETAPRFAALVGKGSLDYRDLMGRGGNWLPPALAPNAGGSFPSDSMLGDVVGDDGVPEIAIGRFPITTGEELGRIIDVIESFEAGHASMDALFAADDSEHDEFAAAARLLTEWVDQERVQEIDLNTEGREDARERLLSMWGSLSWMTYLGHSGLDRMAGEGLLTSADVSALAPMSGTPFVVGWTCNMVRFDIPGYRSLGEQLLTEGASAGVFSATGWSNHFETNLLRNTFAEAVFASEAETIGDAMIRAHQAASDASVSQHRVYLLLGDPALRLRPAAAQPEPDPGSDPPPSGSPDAPPAPRGVGDDPAASVSGCGIAPPGAGHGPYGLSILVLAAVLGIRRRRA